MKLADRYEKDLSSRSNLRFNKSEAEDEDRNIEVRTKLSFFKNQMVLYRGH